ncbi:MAG: flagellar motor protein MotD [Pseudomonadales bacterium]|nr:flagellar motor protein MotD [Pseudomonadales bacterium]
MARKKKHEEHVNSEAWAIPFGDLMILLLAFFVVMYAISSVNEGKYRAASNSLKAAFRGTPRTIQPIQFGEVPAMSTGTRMPMDSLSQQNSQVDVPEVGMARDCIEPTKSVLEKEKEEEQERVLDEISADIRAVLSALVQANAVTVTKSKYGLEVEIKSAILFSSGEAVLSKAADKIIRDLSAILMPYNNRIHVEGHTDNIPMRSRKFTSNWELSTARASSVMHLLMDDGIQPHRLAIVGRGAFKPKDSNKTAQGRSNNRRVTLMILSGEEDEDVMRHERSTIEDSSDNLDDSVDDFFAPDDEEF